MKKRTVSFIISSPILLVVAIYALLISPLGGPTVKVIANTFVPNLAIERIEGGFADDLTITNLTWHNPQWKVDIGYAYVDVTWRCLFEPRVCANDIAVSDARITQVSEAPTDADTSAQPGEIVLPLPIEVTTLTLSNINLSLLNADIALGELALEGFEGNDAIVLESLAAQRIAISLVEESETTSAPSKPEAAASSDSAIPVSYSLSYSAPSLPAISAPMPITLGTVLLEDVSYVKGNSQQKIKMASLSDASFKGNDVAVDSLIVVHPDAELKGSIQASLANNFALESALKVKTKLGDSDQVVTLDAKGALDDLSLSVAATGAVQANVNVTANVLNDALPLEFTATWAQQPIPTMEDATLKAGELSLTGTMGDYILKGNGAATLPDIGDVPVALDVVLKKHNIYVNQANIQALEGSLVNSGTLYLDKVIAWEGKTVLNEVSAARFSQYAPTRLKGEVDSILQYSAQGGLHVSLRDMNIAGELQGKQLHVKGNAVYSGPSDLFVTNVSVQQDKNTIRAVAQVLNKRHLNADVDVDVAQIETLYPEVSGAIKGNIKAVGPWQNPSADGAININDIRVSSTVSAAMAEQGPINGRIAIEGAYTDHKADIALNVPEHQVKLMLAGAWQNNHWKGSISETQLKVANMQWTLSQPFDVDIGTAPVTANISAHCWSSRKEGELCISNVNYQEDRASWDINASALPVGLWASEIAPHVVSAPSSATLNVNTKGSYSPNDPIDATFTASLSAAPWQLGQERPLTLTINSVETTGSIKQGQLTSTSLISSEDIGDATLSLNTRPLDDRKPLEGELLMEGLDVSPFKPLSPAIRTLTGILNGKITLGGYVDDPSLSGELSISNGAIDIQDTPVSLSDWEQQVVLNGQTAELDGKFVLGGGKGSLKGTLDWSATPSADLTLKGNAFEVRQPNVRLRLSPNITVIATKEKVDVTGDINIPWARIEIESLPESAVSPSKDVHLRGEPQREEPLDIVHASVLVNIDKAKTEEVKLEAFGLTASLHGGIRVNTQPALVGYGDLQILNGRYNAYGQKLIIQTGEVQFNGPIDQPMLLVEAIRDPAKTDDDVIAGIRIDGAADSPSINLYSEPAMDQQSVLSYLLTGSGPNSPSADPNYAALLLGFGLSNTKTLTGQVGNALGIDDFSLSTNEDRLSVTGQINDRLSVEYNVDVGLSNNDANSTLRRRQLPPDLALKYQLLPSLYLEAIQTTLEDQSEFALDLYYEFFLGDNRTSSNDEDDESANEESDTSKDNEKNE
ncbi:translocation/assembly module TamB domain-containing protein [Alteromonas sp. McT4-15]|uniref:translocation/assembly module TamB domain-containing protein n=1 Tax=Alteromonas sp. McT4-15 TaxID=2881256 RepID=UPI001CF7F0EB|nr:translocation/assembly module TamB domain-containing protein [Alteromonas sp. McT4-15]MCB4437801.1 translocation/assembly module TamB domain-containing protein [Alteromonas sp. McT4-15]